MEMFSPDFLFRNAILGGWIVCVLCAVLGVYVALRRMVLLGVGKLAGLFDHGEIGTGCGIIGQHVQRIGTGMETGIAFGDCAGMRIGFADFIGESTALHVRIEALVTGYDFLPLIHSLLRLRWVAVCRTNCKSIYASLSSPLRNYFYVVDSGHESRSHRFALSGQ